MLLEIFYGLAIASGLEQVAPRLFGYDGVKVNTPEWRQLVFASCLSLAIAVGDWLAFNLQPHSYKRPLRLILDILFPATIFVLFATSHVPWFFLLLVAAYSVLALFHLDVLMLEGGKPFNKEQFMGIRAVILTVTAEVTFAFWFRESPHYATVAWVAMFIVAAYTVCSWAIIWKELGRLLSE